MQDHLKERLTGAAILVVIVVLLVPELLSGPPAGNARSGAAAGGPPVRSVMIDLRDSAGAQMPAAANATPPETLPADSEPPSAHLSAPAAPTPPQPAIKNVQEAAPASDAAPPPAAKEVPAKAPTAPSAHAAKPKTGWTVQVGSFARRDYADRMVRQLSAKGYSLEVAGPDDRGLYRVRSAPVADRAAAQALKQKMQSNGLKPIVNTVP